MIESSSFSSVRRRQLLRRSSFLCCFDECDSYFLTLCVWSFWWLTSVKAFKPRRSARLRSLPFPRRRQAVLFSTFSGLSKGKEGHEVTWRNILVQHRLARFPRTHCLDLSEACHVGVRKKGEYLRRYVLCAKAGRTVAQYGVNLAEWDLTHVGWVGSCWSMPSAARMMALAALRWSKGWSRCQSDVVWNCSADRDHEGFRRLVSTIAANIGKLNGFNALGIPNLPAIAVKGVRACSRRAWHFSGFLMESAQIVITVVWVEAARLISILSVLKIVFELN